MMQNMITVNEPCSDSNKTTLQGDSPEICRVEGKSDRKMLQTEDNVSWEFSCFAKVHKLYKGFELDKPRPMCLDLPLFANLL